MNDTKYWKQFEKTGNILDYLNYTACTCERYTCEDKEMVYEKVEGGNNVRSGSNRHDTIIHANRRF